jgi:hypothetical protein
MRRAILAILSFLKSQETLGFINQRPNLVVLYMSRPVIPTKQNKSHESI